MTGAYADLAGQAGLAVVERFVDLLRMPTRLLNWRLEGGLPAIAESKAAEPDTVALGAANVTGAPLTRGGLIAVP